jgi:ion channel-forming bestrophin family protein
VFVARKLNWGMVWVFAWRNLLRTALISVAVYVAYEWLGWRFVAIPFLPVATIGTAVAFYLGFKNNSSYERLWEGRRIWGAIVNQSRGFAAQVLATIRAPQPTNNGETLPDIQRELLYRQIAWVNVLRLQLRRRIAWMYDEKKPVHHLEVVGHLQNNKTFEEEISAVLQQFTSAQEYAELKDKSNIANHLLRRQAQRITQLKRNGLLDEYEHSDMMRQVLEGYNNQGAAERIKTFPFPRQYGIFSNLFVNIFIVLLPFALIREMATLGRAASWLVIPFSLLISWIFYTMEQVGESSEAPFENGLNDVPMTAICRNIEVDLRELLGEQNLPQRLQPVDKVLL